MNIENNSFTEAQLLRMKAEAKLQLNQKTNGSIESESYNKNLLHVLQFHLI